MECEREGDPMRDFRPDRVSGQDLMTMNHRSME